MSKLVQIQKTVVSSPVAFVKLTGINTTDIYVCTFNNVTVSVDGGRLRLQFTESGTANSNTNYQWAGRGLRPNGTAYTQQIGGTSSMQCQMAIGTATGENASGTFHIFNANNSSDFTNCILKSTTANTSGEAQGTVGGGQLNENTEVDGLNFISSSGNISGGTFTLFRQVGS